MNRGIYNWSKVLPAVFRRSISNKDGGSPDTMPTRLRTALLLTEALVCFALPAYLFFWAVITAPMFYFAWMRGGTYAAWNLVYLVCGCFGLVSLARFVRYLVSADRRRTFHQFQNFVFGLLGLAAIWSAATERFARFDIVI